MSSHETVVREENIQPGSDRSFGLVVGGILSAIGAYQAFVGSAGYLWFAAPGVTLCVLGIAAPNSLHKLNIAWTQLGVLLGRIVTPVVMFLVYVVSVVPIGLLLRLSGKDLLSLKKGRTKATYWVARTPPGPSPESLRDQF